MKKIKKRHRPRSYALVAAISRGGAGRHSDKRFKRNKKRRKFNPSDGWQ